MDEKSAEGRGLILILMLIFGLAVWYKFGIPLPDGASSGQDREEWLYGGTEVSDYLDQTTYSSNGDRDGDGISDAQDILNNARAYLSTEPSYESRYYESGYPDDGYGVCTDVIAFALRGAGFDLMELLNQNVKNNPGAYEIEVPDKCIDFRRVQNQITYFRNTATSLTVNIYDTSEWQPGDIVAWEDHIAIISDKRNSEGIPYVLHHSREWQDVYEEDVLEDKGDIIGHYRVK
ncbi:MAG: DUF1287 domain-containing protein [Clostridiales bacterium]|nr:DUF1287 domain-containing protein [Candidatus Blautia equi]